MKNSRNLMTAKRKLISFHKDSEPQEVLQSQVLISVCVSVCLSFSLSLCVCMYVCECVDKEEANKLERGKEELERKTDGQK